MKQLALIALLGAAACGGKSEPPTGPGPSLPTTTPDPTATTEPTPTTPTAPPPAKGNPREDLIPRSVLLGNPERGGVRLSHDGKWISWLAPVNGVMNIHVAPVGKLDQAVVVTKETVRPIRNYSWAYTNKHLLYAQDTAGDENFHVWRVDLAAGLDKATVADLTPSEKPIRAEISDLSDKVPGAVLVTLNDRNPQFMDLYKVDLATGKRELLVQNDEGYLGFYTGAKLDVRFTQTKEADGTTVMWSTDPKAKPTAPGKLVWTEFQRIPFEDADTTSLLGLAPSEKSVYFSDTRGRDTGALVEYDLKTKQQKVLAEDPKADVQGAMIHPTKRTLQAVSFEYLRESWKVLDKSIQKDLDALAKLDGGEPTVVSRTLDDKTWLVATTSEQKPQEYWLWDRKKQKGTYLFSGRPDLAKYALLKQFPQEIAARDGLTLVSYLTLPAASDPEADGKANTPAPLVLLVHGGPWARDAWGYNPMHQLLANRGYAVLSVNFRGSTGFGKKFMNAGNLQWGKAMHTDLLDAVAWAVKNGVTTENNTCIMGGSYGGYAALAGLAFTPDAFKCGVDIVGPSNLSTLLATIPPYWAPMVAMFHTRMGNPETKDGKALLEAASPLNAASAIKKPLIIFQGANDPRVKQSESEQIVAAMKKAGLPVTYVLFPDEGHGFARPENNIAFVGAAEAFLSAHLGGTYLPLTKAEVSASTMQVKEGRSGVPGLDGL